jgi:hypothetical protein
MAACLRVLYAGSSVTIQDNGRHGYLRYGVTPAGPMDWTAFRTANLALGNDFRPPTIQRIAGSWKGATLAALVEATKVRKLHEKEILRRDRDLDRTASCPCKFGQTSGV